MSTLVVFALLANEKAVAVIADDLAWVRAPSTSDGSGAITWRSKGLRS
jgi:hypothetical protein